LGKDGVEKEALAHLQGRSLETRGRRDWIPVTLGFVLETIKKNRQTGITTKRNHHEENRGEFLDGKLSKTMLQGKTKNLRGKRVRRKTLP